MPLSEHDQNRIAEKERTINTLLNDIRIHEQLRDNESDDFKKQGHTNSIDSSNTLITAIRKEIREIEEA